MQNAQDLEAIMKDPDKIDTNGFQAKKNGNDPYKTFVSSVNSATEKRLNISIVNVNACICKKLIIYYSKICMVFVFQKDHMELLVLAPLSTLLGMFASPQKLIQKRYDKLLDYCSQLDSRSSKEEQGQAKKDYEALNAQLLEELQFFNQAVRTVLTNCLFFIVKLIRELMDEAQPPVQQLPVSKSRWKIKDAIKKNEWQND